MENQFFKENILFKNLHSNFTSEFSDSSCFLEFNENEKIFSQGENSDSILIIKKGLISLQINNQEVAERTSGEIIGEQGLIDNMPRSTDAFAKKATSIFKLDKNDFSKFSDTYPVFMKNLLAILSSKLRQSSNERGTIYKRDFLLRQVLSSHVSKRAYGELIQKIDDLIPKKIDDKFDIDPPKKVKGIVQFIDIRSFTRLSEKYNLEIIQELLMNYFNIVTKVTNQYNGQIDKFLGDGVLIYYIGNCDIIAEDAVNAAFQILRDINEYDFGIDEKIQIGIGMDCGDFLFGPFGSSLRMEYTIIGDTVNTASRIQDKTKEYNTNCIISEKIFNLCTNNTKVFFEEIGYTELRNKSNKITLFKRKEL